MFVTRTRLSWVFVSLCVATVAGAVLASLIISVPKIQRVPALAANAYPSFRITVPRTSQVVHLSISEGSRVRRGQVLAQLSSFLDDEARTRSDIERVTASRTEALTQQQLRDQWNSYASEKADLQAALTALKAQQTLLLEDVSDQAEALNVAQREFEAVEAVASRGFVSKSEINRRLLALIQQRAHSRDAKRRAGENEKEILRLSRKIQQADIDARIRQFNTQRDRLHASAANDLARAGDRFLLRAPADGVISALVAYPGGSVRAGGAIATVVPERSPVHAILYVSSAAIGTVRLGQEVRLRFDSYPYYKYGDLTAHIESISRAVVLPHDSPELFNLTEPTFKVVATIDRAQVSKIPVAAGMTGSGLIVTGRRTLIDLLVGH